MNSEPRGISPILPAPAAARPRTIAFTSGKGGVGKSNVVLNLGLTLARRGRRVMLLDGDLGLASLNVLLGMAPRHDLRHVLAGERRLDEILLRGPYGLRIIPAGSGVAELASLDHETRERLLATLDELASTVDFLLVDTGAGINDTVLELILAADEAVVVTRPEPTAVADAYALMKVVIREHPSYPFHLLINMARDAAEADQVFASLSHLLVRFLGYRPGNAGHVPLDPVVARGVVDQVPFTVGAPRSQATRGVERLAESLLGARPAPASTAAFWQRVVAWHRRPA